MPVIEQGDLEVAYDIVGEGEDTWVITPGGRFSKDYGGVREMAEALAEHGKRVLIYDRLNCGASAVSFTGGSESVMQADSLAELLRQLDFGPTVIIGGSGGSRVSLLTAARHPDIARGLGIWWTVGGTYGLMGLGQGYCAPSIAAVWNGTMDDVANLETWQEVVERNPKNRDRFLSYDAAEFKATMLEWMHAYCACGDPLVPGLSEERVTRINFPILVFRSGQSDMHHTRETSERLAAALPGARMVEPPWEDREWLDRVDANGRGEGTLFSRWSLLVPQLLEWANEALS